MERGQKIEEFLLKGNYDSKHINNLSSRKVPAELLKAVEEGCSLETLKQLAQGFPICKYETQITIHGIFDTPSTNRVGEYCNLIQNKNKSLGVRWTAIDREKKSKLVTILRAAQKGWRIEGNSQALYIVRSKTVYDRQEAAAVYTQYKKQVEGIDRTLFTGSASCKICHFYGTYTIFLILDVKCFYFANMMKLASNITGKTEDQLHKDLKAYEEEQERERLEREKSLGEFQKKWDEEKNLIKQAREDFLTNNPIPEGYKRTENYRPEVGDMLIKLNGIRYKYELERDGFCYVYYVITKSFGKLIVTPCDKDGNKTGKSGIQSKDVYKVQYVKKAKSEQEKKQETRKNQTATANGLTVTEAGKGIFIGGNTYPHRKQLKELGGKWDGVKKAWYFGEQDAEKARAYAAA